MNRPESSGQAGPKADALLEAARLVEAHSHVTPDGSYVVDAEAMDKLCKEIWKSVKRAGIFPAKYPEPAAAQSQKPKTDAPAIIHCEIRDEFGDVESAATVLTSNEAYHWYEEHGASFHAVKMSENGFTFQRPAAAQPALDGDGRIEPMNSYDYGQFNPMPAAAQPATCPKCGAKSNSKYKCPNCFALLPAQPAKAAHEIDYKVGDKIIRARSYEEAVAKAQPAKEAQLDEQPQQPDSADALRIGELQAKLELAETLAAALRSVDYAWTNYRKDYKAIGYETIKQVRSVLAAWDKREGK